MEILQHAIDPNLANDGVWCDIDDVTKVRVARMDNKNFTTRVRELILESGANVAEGVDDDLQEEITIKAIAECILVDWQGITLDGKEFPYSRDNAIALLREPALMAFREKVCSFAMSAHLYRTQEVEDDLKKSLAL